MLKKKETKLTLWKKLAAGLLFVILLFTVVVQPKAAAAKIKLNKTKATIYTKGTTTVQLKATVSGLASKVKWKSSNTKVATVNSSGKVTAKKAGKTVITAKAGKKTAKCTVTVKKKAGTEVSKYFGNYIKLVSALKMEKYSTGQYSNMKNGFKKNDFTLEYTSYDSANAQKDYEYTMYNKGNKNVLLYGYTIGDSYSKISKKLKAAGWACLDKAFRDDAASESHSFLGIYKNKHGYSKSIMLTVHQTDGKITSWILNNWPQWPGDDSIIDSDELDKAYVRAEAHPING